MIWILIGVAVIFVVHVCVSIGVSSDEDRRQIKMQNEDLSRMNSNIEEACSVLVDFLYKAIVYKIRLCIERVGFESIDPLLFARRLPRWINEYSSAEINQIKSKNKEDDVSREIASICRWSDSIRYSDLTDGCVKNADKIIRRKIDSSIDGLSYLTIASAHIVLDEIMHSPIISESIVRYFLAIKQKWPSFSWTDEDEAGYLEDDYE